MQKCGLLPTLIKLEMYIYSVQWGRAAENLILAFLSFRVHLNQAYHNTVCCIKMPPLWGKKGWEDGGGWRWTDWPDIQRIHPVWISYAWFDSKDNHNIFILLLWAAINSHTKWKQAWISSRKCTETLVHAKNLTSLKLQKDTLKNHMALSSTTLFNLPVALALTETQFYNRSTQLHTLAIRRQSRGWKRCVHKTKTA